MKHKLTIQETADIIKGLAKGEFPVNKLSHITGMENILPQGKFDHFPEIGIIKLNPEAKRALLRSVVEGVLDIEDIPSLKGQLTILEFWAEVSGFEN